MMKRLALAVAMLCAISTQAQRPALTSPVIRFQDQNGKPLAGGKLFSYQAGTTTPLATYVDSTTGAVNTNPVILDSTGSATVFLGNNVYKLVLQNAAGSVQWTADNIAQNAFNQGGGGGPTGAAGGDLSGTYPNPRVVKINGQAVPVSQANVGTDASGHIVPGASVTTYYQTIQDNSTALAQEPVLNLIPGTGTAITCVDNPTNHSTDCTFDLGSSAAVDYYWTEAGCVIGVGQPNHCDFTATLPGAMPSASYQVFCTINFLSDTPAAACNPAQATLPMTSGGSILMRIGQYQQNGTTGFTAPTIYMHAHYGTGGGGGGGGGGFPFTLGSTAIAALSTTTALNGMTINGCALSSTGSTGLFLTEACTYASPTGSGTVTSVATTAPLAGGPVTTSGTLSCPTCIVATSPGNGIGHFAGSTQTITSSAVDLGTSDVTGLLPHTNILSTAVTPGSYTNANITVQADGTITGASNGSAGSSGISGATSGQALIAGSATTATSSKAIAGAGAGLTTGPTSATSGDVALFTGGAGAVTDGALASSTLVKATAGTLTSGTIPKAATANAVVDSALSDNGTTVTSTEPVAAPSFAAGTPSAGALAALPSGSHGFACDESTTAGVPASGVDYVRCDGTTHTILGSVNGSAEATLFPVSGGTTTIASGTSSLGTSSISTASCATVVTTTATGVASTDGIIWNTNASIKAVTGYTPSTSGGLTINAYPTTNAVNYDVCNWTSGSITPGAVTLNWRVVR